MANPVSEKLEQLKNAFNEEETQVKPKTVKKGGKLKMLAAFGTGATLGTAVTGYIAYRLFKGFFGGFLGSL